MMPPALILALVLLGASPFEGLSTTAERSDFLRTGRIGEVDALCQRLRTLGQGCDVYGVTPEGRPLQAFVLSSVAASSADAHKRSQRPVVAFIAGIHAGEIDGKDASTLVIKEILQGGFPGVLERITVVVIPVFNVDGHERFGRHQRPNQHGPQETGWRTTAQNLNLNRDWVKADAPETQALLTYLNKWDPTLVVDLHVTDGAKFRHDVALIAEPSTAQLSPLAPLAVALRDRCLRDLQRQGHLPLDFYPAFEVDDEPASGFSVGVTPGRLTHGYWALRDRLALLVETHSWRPYKERVKTTADVMRSVLTAAQEHAGAWRQAARAADDARRRTAGRDVILTWDNAQEAETLAFLGYSYERVSSEISGALWTRYDDNKPAVWQVPMRRALVAGKTTKAPGWGYAVPAGFASEVAARLRLHGINFAVLEQQEVVTAQVFRAHEVSFGQRPYEGRMTAKATGAWTVEKRTLPAGSLVIGVNQPRARLLLEMFEPDAIDSLLGWGFFNAAFEQKEYMEAYVAEEEARRLLKNDPALKHAFEQLLAQDPAFARDAEARLRFFYRRTPSFDERMNLVPVYRLEGEPVHAGLR